MRRQMGAKNMVVTRLDEVVAGDISDAGYLIEQFGIHLKDEDYKQSTVGPLLRRLKNLVKKGTVLLEPLSVKRVTANQEKWSDGYKRNVMDAIDLLYKWLNILGSKRPI